MKRTITIADLVLGVGGLVTFIFSFLAFFDLRGFDGVNAWDGDAGAFATTVPAILGLVAVVWIVLELVGVKLPQDVLTYNTAQLKGTWGIGAFGIMLSWISADFGGADKGAGFWLMFIGSLAMAAGAVMGLLGMGTDTVDLPGGAASDGAADGSAPMAPPAPDGGSATPPPPPPPASPDQS